MVLVNNRPIPKNMSGALDGAALNDARKTICDWQKHYNHERPYSSLGYQAPAVFEANAA